MFTVTLAGLYTRENPARRLGTGEENSSERTWWSLLALMWGHVLCHKRQSLTWLWPYRAEGAAAPGTLWGVLSVFYVQRNTLCPHCRCKAQLLSGEVQSPRVPVGCVPVLMTSKFTASFANPNSSTAKQTHSCFSWSQSSMVALQHVYLNCCWFPLFPVDQRPTLIDSRFWKQKIWIIENIKLLQMVKKPLIWKLT